MLLQRHIYNTRNNLCVHVLLFSVKTHKFPKTNKEVALLWPTLSCECQMISRATHIFNFIHCKCVYKWKLVKICELCLGDLINNDKILKSI